VVSVLEWPRAVVRATQPAALQIVLDAAEDVGILCAEVALPGPLEIAAVVGGNVRCC
jgi:hypothetical protein